MDVGIGLPTTIPGVEGSDLIEWARRAEQRGFSSLGVIDRVVYPNYEPLIALAAAAAVTERIRLTTAIVIVPNRLSATLLAKQIATIHHLSGGRLVLGAGIGARQDDYQATGAPLGGRGKRFEQMLAEMQRVWEGDEIGPSIKGGPPVVIGGRVDAAFRRAGKYDGWIMGRGTPDQLADGRARTERAWNEAGREGEPRIMALAYFALGPRAKQNADSNLRRYYAYAAEVADEIVATAATNPDTIKQNVKDFAAAGCEELILFPNSTEVSQVDLLAEAAL